LIIILLLKNHRGVPREKKSDLLRPAVPLLRVRPASVHSRRLYSSSGVETDVAVTPCKNIVRNSAMKKVCCCHQRFLLFLDKSRIQCYILPFINVTKPLLGSI
jgi:hypothetical protein